MNLSAASPEKAADSSPYRSSYYELAVRLLFFTEIMFVCLLDHCHTVRAQLSTCYLSFPYLLLRWPGVVRSVPQATDLAVVKGLRSRDSPLLSLRPSLPLLWWN